MLLRVPRGAQGDALEDQIVFFNFKCNFAIVTCILFINKFIYGYRLIFKLHVE